MMFSDFFRDFFRGHRQRDERPVDDHHLGDNYRNPIWQNDDEDDDLDDFRNSFNHFRFKIHFDPNELMRVFEPEMNNLFKNFFYGFATDDFFTDPSISSLPPAEDKTKSLRDQVLKDESFNHDKFDESRIKKDSDLDGRITTDTLVKFWNHESSPNPQTFSFRSSFKEFIQKPDGSIEKKETYIDHEGNEKTTITRQIGDKKYVITTEKNKHNEEIRREEITDIDKNECLVPKGTNFNSIFDHPLWGKFFGPNPKL